MERDELTTLIGSLETVDHRSVQWDAVRWTAYLIYQHGFFQNDLNGAAALGVIMLLVLAVFSFFYVRLTAKQEG